VLVVCVFTHAMAQPGERKNSPEEYIAKYREEALAQMHLYHIPASITIAQGMLESGNGNSALSVYANNHFGIKCHKEWNGDTYYMDDDEKNECFRKYGTVLDSYNDHSLFLTSRDRYQSLFKLPRTDYKAWAKGLKEAGYATHPQYAQLLIELIEKYKLYELDSSSDMEVISSVKNSHPYPKLEMREIIRFNHSKFIIVKPGESFMKIADELNMEVERLLKFNDLNSKSKLIAGQKLYIERKRRKALEPIHIVQKGETMHSISQLHGIRLYWLYKRNNIKEGNEPITGEILMLRPGATKKIIQPEIAGE
jgi:LysM repeat protein